MTDKIRIAIGRHQAIDEAIGHYADYIASQTLAVAVELTDALAEPEAQRVEIDDEIATLVRVEKI